MDKFDEMARGIYAIATHNQSRPFPANGNAKDVSAWIDETVAAKIKALELISEYLRALARPTQEKTP